MSSQSPHFGEQFALEFPPDAETPRISPTRDSIPIEAPASAEMSVTVRTVQELVDLVSEKVPKPRAAMMRTAVGHACEYLRLPAEECPVDRLLSLGDGFVGYLRMHRYSKHSVHAYRTHIKMLLQFAESHGVALLGVDEERGLRQAWEQILTRISKGNFKVCRPVVMYAINQRQLPGDFHEADLAKWVQYARNAGRTMQYVKHVERQFRTLAGEHRDLALHDIKPATPVLRYGVDFQSLPEKLRNEIQEILAWKQSPFAAGRPAKYRHRPVTALSLRDFFCRLYGFAIRYCDLLPTSIGELIVPDVLCKYCSWYIEERNHKGKSLLTFLGMLYSITKRHPSYSQKSWDWFSELINQIPEDPASALREARERKWLPYQALSEIPHQLHEHALSLTPGVEKAKWIRNELLMLMLIALNWRGRNLRECKLAPEKESGNVFKSPLPQGAGMAVPQWVEEDLKRNPAQEFWQFYFREKETKAKQVVRAVLPTDVASLLAEYVNEYRPLLVSNNDPGTLLVDHHGGKLKPFQVTDLVARITERFAGKRVTPHTFRSIFAVSYLRDNPEDYLTVQRQLWHSNPLTTIRIYGAGFNEADAARRVEKWRIGTKTKS